MRQNILLLLLLVGSVCAMGQTHTISGYVEEAETGERLLGATVYNINNPMQGTTTNHYGFFTLTVPEGDITLRFSFVGYANHNISFALKRDTSMNVVLYSNTTLDEVVVSARRSEVDNPQMSKVDVPIELVQKAPALLGEVDILKTIQLLPGVQGGTEGTSGIYVRGGGPDQNLILLDGVPVYNASHLFGFFSVFNASAISDVSLIKGGFPARYGGRLSSVLDIRMKEGNMKEFKGEFDIGIISTKLTLEGPIIRDKTSFIVSGRRTYLDILAAPIVAHQAKKNGNSGSKAGYFFHDINAKVNHKFSDRDRLYLSFYTGLDKAYTSSDNNNEGKERDKLDFSLDWGNYTTALRWNHVFNPKLFSNTTLTYSQYRFEIDVDQTYIEYNQNQTLNETNYKAGYHSGINDWSGRIDFEYSPSPVHSVRFGVSGIYHTFKPGVTSVKVDEANADKIDLSFGQKNLHTTELDAYVEDEIRFNSWFTANIGVHGSAFLVRDTSFVSIQPRASLRFLANDRLSIKASYASMQQYLHLLTNSTIGLPTDLWLPATNRIKPQESQQVALGAVFQANNEYSLSLEGFYKYMYNLVEYKEGASFFDSFDEGTGATSVWEDKVTQGQGWAYGLEVLLKKDLGKLRGWLGYTLSWTNRQFDDVAFGKVFPYRYDRRHDINLMLTYKLSEKVDFAATWVYGTGNAVTLPMQTYASNYNIEALKYSQESLNYYEKRNNYRMPAFHRLDVGVNFHKQKKHGHRTWSIGLYNAYSRKNPFFLNFQTSYSNGTKKKNLVQYSLFPIIPSISYKYKF